MESQQIFSSVIQFFSHWRKEGSGLKENKEKKCQEHEKSSKYFAVENATTLITNNQ